MTQTVAVLGTGKIGEALLSGMIRVELAPGGPAGHHPPPRACRGAPRPLRRRRGHQRRGGQARRHPHPGGQAPGHGPPPRRADPPHHRRPPGHQRRGRHHDRVHRGAPHHGHPGGPCHAEHPRPGGRGHVRHLRGQPRHHRPPRHHRDDLRRRRQDPACPRVPAGRGHRPLRLGPGLLLLPRRGHDGQQASCSACPAPRPTTSSCRPPSAPP